MLKKIGNLHYEVLAEFLDKLCDKLIIDAAKDSAGGRKILAQSLENAAENIQFASIDIEKAWKISKPFMEKK